MADISRIDDLRRRVQKDPASIAFAQLAEELRRSGAHHEAVETCRAGLEIHPGYLSARVTLGRALVELGELDEAQSELARVLASAPENLAAIRGLAEIYHRRGDLGAALEQYRAALLLARNDPDLEETIADLSRQVEPPKQAPTGGLTLQHMQDELLKHTPPPRPDRRVHLEQAGSPRVEAQETDEPAPTAPRAAAAAAQAATPVTVEPVQAVVHPAARFEPAAIFMDSAGSGTLTPPTDDRPERTVAALEQWLAAIHVSRHQRHS